MDGRVRKPIPGKAWARKNKIVYLLDDRTRRSSNNYRDKKNARITRVTGSRRF
jgi:hypothetical protein